MAPRARRRLRRIARHVRPREAAVETHTAVITRPLEPEQPAPETAAQGNFSDARLAEYVSRGFCLLTPEDLGVDMAVHHSLFDRTVAATAEGQAFILGKQANNAGGVTIVKPAAQQQLLQPSREDERGQGGGKRPPPEQVGSGVARLQTDVEMPPTREEDGARLSATGKDKLFFARNLIAEVPQMIDILDAPGLRSAVDKILGPGFAIVPYGNDAIQRGSADQHWHKDDILPWNARKPGLRHHHLETIDMFYYPQEVTEHIGPTSIVAHSQYWTLDHDENQDNICIEMLDYNFVREKMGENPDLEERDRRFDAAVAGTGWPLVKQVKVCVPAGSVILMNHNCFHRGQRRRDDPAGWPDRARFMWRLWLYRTTEPEPAPADAPAAADCSALLPAVDALTDIPLHVPEAAVVWNAVQAWTSGVPPPAAQPGVGTLSELKAQLLLSGEEFEPQRIAAGYHLAALGAEALPVLQEAFVSDRESVRRAATHAIVAAGPEAVEAVALAAANSPFCHKWARKNAAFALGESGSPSTPVLEALASLLGSHDSVHVRATCAASVGLVGRRAVAQRKGEVVSMAVSILLDSLGREGNRFSQDLAQNRGIYDIRPTDESDLCEGSGAPAGDLPILRPDGTRRFGQVRSAVRENALWSAVMLASSATALPRESAAALRQGMLEVIERDDNLVCVGFATDALYRLSAGMGGEALEQAEAVMEAEPVVCYASSARAKRFAAAAYGAVS